MIYIIGVGITLLLLLVGGFILILLHMLNQDG